MPLIPTHAGTQLPLALDTATLVIALGIAVFGVIAYDLYRHWWLGGGDRWQ